MEKNDVERIIEERMNELKKDYIEAVKNHKLFIASIYAIEYFELQWVLDNIKD